jgi:hypothetical protein
MCRVVGISCAGIALVVLETAWFAARVVGSLARENGRPGFKRASDRLEPRGALSTALRPIGVADRAVS